MGTADLYSRQDTRMYHYPYAWEALTNADARMDARARTDEGRFTCTRYTHTEYPARTGIDLAYPIDTSGLSLFLFFSFSSSLHYSSLALSSILSLSGHSQFYELFQDP